MPDYSGVYHLPFSPKCTGVVATKRSGPGADDVYDCVWHYTDKPPIHDTVGTATVRDWLKNGAWVIAYPANQRVSEGL